VASLERGIGRFREIFRHSLKKIPRRAASGSGSSQLAEGDVIVKLSNLSGANAVEAIQIYGDRVWPKLRG
jgi:hypothetical protein